MFQSITYAGSPIAIRCDLAEAHDRCWQRLGRPGTWWTGAARIAIAAETRAARGCELCARRKAALSPFAVEGDHPEHPVLPPAAVDAVHRITTDAARLTGDWVRSRLGEDFTEGHYVELLATAAAVIAVDGFCTALGLPEHQLPDPQPGEPSRYRPPRLERATGWVSMVPNDNVGTPEADLWSPDHGYNVVRALSLVPDEVRVHEALSAAHYLARKDVGRAGVDRGGPLNRSQIELIAGRVSAVNECFY